MLWHSYNGCDTHMYPFLHDLPCTASTLQHPATNITRCTDDNILNSMDERKHKERKEKYRIIRKIGQGTFGKVYEAEDENRRKVAIKRVVKATNVISREVDILKVINHDYCLKLLDVFYTSEDGAPTRKFQNMVFDYFPQTLYHFIQDNYTEYTPRHFKILFYQLCLAIRHIHDQDICHRDVTPNNVLMSNKGHIVLADFGSAKKLDAEHVSMSYVCARYYRAPELLLGCTNYAIKVDIWSAGCILAEMLMGKPLFPGTDNQDQFMKIVLVLGAPSSSDISAMNPSYKESIKFPHIDPLYFGSLLPKSLPESELVADLLYGMLCYNPASRLSIDSVIKHPYFNDIRGLPLDRLNLNLKFKTRVSASGAQQ